MSNIKEDNFITLSDLNDSIKEIITTGGGHFEYIWRQSNTREKITLALLPGIVGQTEAAFTTSDVIIRADKYKIAPERDEVEEVLSSFKKRQIIKEKADGIYEFLGDIYCEWLSRNKRPEVLVKEGLKW